MPWLAVFVGGLWIPNLFYWGLNQFITQRTLAAESLAEAQKGIFFAASLKLLIPFIIVFPGIMAAELYADQITNADQAYPILMRELLPAGLTGIMFAALFGAVMSSLDSMLNSAATIFTIDLFKRYRAPDASPARLVKVGRTATAVLVVIGYLWAPVVASAGRVFQYIQMFWGFISPGIVAVFAFGMLSPRTPPIAAKGAMVLVYPSTGRYSGCLRTSRSCTTWRSHFLQSPRSWASSPCWHPASPVTGRRCRWPWTSHRQHTRVSQRARSWLRRLHSTSCSGRVDRMRSARP